MCAQATRSLSVRHSFLAAALNVTVDISINVESSFVIIGHFKLQPPIVVLNVVVIEAKDLEAKDSDGFSDPYCMLGIRPGIKHLSASRASSTPQSSPKRQVRRK